MTTRILPPRPPVPSVHVGSNAAHEQLSATLDERSYSASSFLARVRGVTVARLLRDLVVAEFKRVVGREPEGATFERPRRWTDPVKRAYQNAYSATYVRAKRAGKPMDERRRLAREAGAEAARKRALVPKAASTCASPRSATRCSTPATSDRLQRKTA